MIPIQAHLPTYSTFSPWAQLPNELLRKILRFLPLSSLQATACVNRQWKQESINEKNFCKAINLFIEEFGFQPNTEDTFELTTIRERQLELLANISSYLATCSSRIQTSSYSQDQIQNIHYDAKLQAFLKIYTISYAKSQQASGEIE